jgi:hypothetical protein
MAPRMSQSPISPMPWPAVFAGSSTRELPGSQNGIYRLHGSDVNEQQNSNIGWNNMWFILWMPMTYHDIIWYYMILYDIIVFLNAAFSHIVCHIFKVNTRRTERGTGWKLVHDICSCLGHSFNLNANATLISTLNTQHLHNAHTW